MAWQPDWQPIETAPKDGTFIMLAGGSYIDDDLEEPMHGPMIGRWFVAGWYVCIAEAGFSVFTYRNPTHWAPCPEGPAPVEEKRRLPGF